MNDRIKETFLKVAFKIHPSFGPVCEQTVFKDSKGAPINESVIERVTDKHIHDYPIEWARFQNSRPSMQPIGTPLEIGLGMEHETAALFVAHGVMDVETFATLSDSRIGVIMPGNPIAGVNMRNRAMMMIPEARRTPLPIDAAAKRAADAAAAKANAVAAERALSVETAMATGGVSELEQLRAQLALSQRREAEAVAQIDALTAPPRVESVADLAGEPLGDHHGEITDAELDALAASSVAAAGDVEPRRGPGRPRKVA